MNRAIRSWDRETDPKEMDENLKTFYNEVANEPDEYKPVKIAVNDRYRLNMDDV